MRFETGTPLLSVSLSPLCICDGRCLLFDGCDVPCVNRPFMSLLAVCACFWIFPLSGCFAGTGRAIFRSLFASVLQVFIGTALDV